MAPSTHAGLAVAGHLPLVVIASSVGSRLSQELRRRSVADLLGGVEVHDCARRGVQSGVHFAE
eukprot:2994349-Pyramimonas_sp.AAC.1